MSPAACQPKGSHKVYQWTKNHQNCLLCGGKADSKAPLCHPCELDLPWLGTQCERCALPLAVDGLCPGCLNHPPPFDRVIAPWRYAFPLDSLIRRFKHQADWPFGHLLGAQLAAHLNEQFARGLPRPACLLAVPLAKDRLRERGFNQAELLAGWLAQALQLPPCKRALRRTRATPAQQELDAKARKRNLRGAFALADGFVARGLHLALVDDVLTTGATAAEIAHLLRQNGAARVDVYCLARTPKASGPPS